MRLRFLLSATLVLLLACQKELPKERDSSANSKSRQIEFALYVKYNPLSQQYGDLEETPVTVPFDKDDQMMVSGEGISGILSYDRHYAYPRGFVFTGYLNYESRFDPPKDLILHIKRINPKHSNDGIELSEPAVANNLKEAVDRFGVYTGTCTFGKPFVNLSLSNSFIELDLYWQTPFPKTWNRIIHFSNEGKAIEPFAVKENTLVLVFPGGSKPMKPMLEVDGIARFPLVPPFSSIIHDWEALVAGGYYLDEIYFHDLSLEWGSSSHRKIVYYQSNPREATYNAIYATATYYPPPYDHHVFLSHVNIQKNQSPITLRVNTFLWVDGDCKVISTEGSLPAICVQAPYSLHILGDGTLTAQCVGSGEGGAGIAYEVWLKEQCGDLSIEGDVSVIAKGAAGAAGIGTGIIEAYYNPDLSLGNISINTSGTVIALGGEGAPGIGIGKIRKWEEPIILSMGGFYVSDGIVDATGGIGACDIGIPKEVNCIGGVTVANGVTYDGEHGYHIGQMKGTLPIGYNKD